MGATTSRIRTQSSTELGRLYRDHFDGLVRQAMRLLDTRHLAEEAVQEAFLSYHAVAGGPRPGCELAYLRVSTMNNARSMMRRKQCAEKWRPETPRTAPAVEDICVARDEDERLKRRCAALPDRQRTVLELRYWHGLSIDEIANLLEISAGSVKTHASRGRKALQRQLVANAA